MLLPRDPLYGYRKQPKARQKTVSAPIGGWNTRAALNEMPPLDAVTLDNWFPTVGSVNLRKGYTSYATGVGAAGVETLLEYHSGASRKFIAAGGGAIYDISSAGVASSLASGFANNRWQGVMFNTKLHMVNGADGVRTFDGTSIATPSWSGSGLTVANLNGVTVFKERLIFWENASQDFWYGGVQGVSGTLTKFPLSMLGRLGGNIVCIASWAQTTQTQTSEMLAIIMSSGEVIVYDGTDPGSADAWSLVGIYRIGAPLHVRGALKVAGDLLILTRDDWESLNRVLLKDRTGKDQASKISGAAGDAAASYVGNFGWQICHFPAASMLLVNVPVSATRFDQHVLNTTTGAWCRFTGMNGRCFATYNDDLYFGGAGGVVYKAWTGTSDAGENIAANAQTAWNHMGYQGPKLMNGVRPVIGATGALMFTMGLAFDFKEVQVEASASSVVEGPQWDVALWDVEQWAPEANIRTDQYDASGEGTDVSLRLRYTGKGQEVAWYRTDYWYTPGFGL